MLKSEKGYSLILTLVVFLILSVLGIFILSLSFNGAKQTETKEEQTQAFYLAKKGMDYFYSDFSAQLGGLENSEIDVFDSKVKEFMKTYDKTLGNKKVFTNEKGHEYTVEIIDYEEIRVNNESIQDKITVQSTGKVNEKTKTLTHTYELGAKRLPDQLKYAVGAKDDNCGLYEVKDGSKKCNNGNIFIHGPASIVGDMYVGGDLITTNQSQHQKGDTSYWPYTDYPSIEGIDKKNPKLTLLGNYYTFNTDKTTSVEKYNEHKKRMDFDNESFDETIQKGVCINQPSKGPCKKYGNITLPKDPYKKNTAIFQEGFKNGYTPELETKPASFKEIDITNSANAIFKGKNVEKSDYYITGEYDAKEGTIFNKDLTINAIDGKKITGPMYVKGDLSINEADVRIDSVIYVEGNVEIKESKIKKLNKGSLIIFAKGNVHLSNINLYTNINNPLLPGIENADALNMFIYTDNELEMYGVGSNIQINGGIFAKRIVLNAAKGNSKKNTKGDTVILQDNQTEIAPKYSRLRIVYNKDLIQNPSLGLPTVEGLDLSLINQKEGGS